MNTFQRRIDRSKKKTKTVTPLPRGNYAIATINALAIKEQRSGNLPAALELYNRLLAKLPDSAEAFNNRGVILQLMGHTDDALASYDQAVIFEPGYANAHYNRGSLLRKMNRVEAALASFDQALSINPNHTEAWHNRGVALQQLRRYDDALASYDRVLAIKPDHAEACNNRGLVLANKGAMSEAETMFRQALAIKPDFSAPLFNLANAHKFESVNNAEVKNIRALLDRPQTLPDDKMSLYFALGKIYDECGRYDEAFEYCRLANQIRNASVAYDAAGVTGMTNGIIEVFSRDFLSQPFAFASDSRSPVFIVGMPRSGTTLLANILSNHPSIATAGELPDISNITLSLPQLTGTGVPYPQGVKHITPGVAARLIKDYEQHLRHVPGSAAPYIIDKNPLNFRHLGLIAMLFPQAHIIHCTRHPLDTCLSNYFQQFPLPLDYSFDLRNIGRFYQEYARLMAHWRQIPALKLIEVSYGDMVMTTESMVRKILGQIGLEWDERCLSPHTNQCVVENASQWQVRQPIYRRSLERWRHYEKHLSPLKEMLGAAGLIPV